MNKHSIDYQDFVMLLFFIPKESLPSQLACTDSGGWDGVIPFAGDSEEVLRGYGSGTYLSPDGAVR